MPARHRSGSPRGLGHCEHLVGLHVGEALAAAAGPVQLHHVRLRGLAQTEAGDVLAVQAGLIQPSFRSPSGALFCLLP